MPTRKLRFTSEQTGWREWRGSSQGDQPYPPVIRYGEMDQTQRFGMGVTVIDYKTGVVGVQAPSVPEIDAFQSRLLAIEARLTRLEEHRELSAVTLLNTLNSESLALLKPVATVLEFEPDGQVAARWTEALLEGAGPTQLDALQDLRESIAEAYLDLREAVREGKTLDGYPARLWKMLSEFVTENAASAGE